MTLKTFLFYGPGADAADPAVENDGIEITDPAKIFLAEMLAYDAETIKTDRYICVLQDQFYRIIET